MVHGTQTQCVLGDQESNDGRLGTRPKATRTIPPDSEASPQSLDLYRHC